MEDPHLNLFYSYNRDSELIENNLTRAWIVSLRLLSNATRGLFLYTVLERPLHELGRGTPPLAASQFALQGHMDKRLLDGLPQKLIITIATSREMDDTALAESGEEAGESIPDAWIFDPEEGYCFLVEAKIGSNPLNARQVLSHAEGWLSISAKDIEKSLIPLTWYDVLGAIRRIDNQTGNLQEHLVLQELSQYLSFFGYRLFEGFDFNLLYGSPDFALLHQPSGNGASFLGFSQLRAAPAFCLGNATRLM